MIADQIKKARKEKGMTQSLLSYECEKRGSGITQTLISEWEIGKTRPTAKSLEVVAEALGKKWRLE